MVAAKGILEISIYWKTLVAFFNFQIKSSHVWYLLRNVMLSNLADLVPFPDGDGCVADIWPILDFIGPITWDQELNLRFQIWALQIIWFANFGIFTHFPIQSKKFSRAAYFSIQLHFQNRNIYKAFQLFGQRILKIIFTFGNIL